MFSVLSIAINNQRFYSLEAHIPVRTQERGRGKEGGREEDRERESVK